jgi:hypothetical protein
MSWRKRLQEIALAGGVVSLVGCGSGAAGTDGGVPIPCGNGNADPCICGRPEANAAAAALCADEMACEDRGGTWSPVLGTGNIETSHCEEDGGVDGGDDASPSD